jgi:tRNA (cytosine49-C5)-methyltransferase
MNRRTIPDMKPLFEERMIKLLGDDFVSYKKILKSLPVKSIRCNTLKISVAGLKEILEKKGWKIIQPWSDYPEVFVIDSNLEPGELGRSLEHLLGYYYVQELASMLPPIVLDCNSNELVLDLCSSPGSKTTQIACFMENKGKLIANEVSMGRLRILASNLERCGVSNVVVTRKDGVAICNRLVNLGFSFDKILVDAPCSGEGTLRSSYKTYLMWNIKNIFSLSRLQKQLASSAFELLKVGGEMVYSTCTHAPEENEEVVNFLLEKYGEEIEICDLELPIKFRKGIKEWEGKVYDKRVEKCARVYPQENNTEGFFVSKFRRVK